MTHRCLKSLRSESANPTGQDVAVMISCWACRSVDSRPDTQTEKRRGVITTMILSLSLSLSLSRSVSRSVSESCVFCVVFTAICVGLRDIVFLTHLSHEPTKQLTKEVPKRCTFGIQVAREALHGQVLRCTRHGDSRAVFTPCRQAILTRHWALTASPARRYSVRTVRIWTGQGTGSGGEDPLSCDIFIPVNNRVCSVL